MKRGEKQEAVKSALIALATERGGQLSPRAVLDAARAETSPLHDYFEWDDTLAAEAFRVTQAMGLIRSVKIKVVTESKDPTRVDIIVQRAFPSLPSLRGSTEGSYVPIATVTDATELVNEVLGQMQTLRKKHANLQKLSGVWKAIDEASAA